MASWNSCRIEVIPLREGLLFEDDDADLRIDGEGLELTYWDERGVVVFSGPPAEDGHYQLVCRSRPRRGTLQWAPGSRVLEGRWEEGEERGRWRVELPEADGEDGEGA